MPLVYGSSSLSYNSNAESLQANGDIFNGCTILSSVYVKWKGMLWNVWYLRDVSWAIMVQETEMKALS